MCGFLLVACTGADARLPHERSELDRLRDVLTHRGPDAGESWVGPEGRIALTHRRLKVIDLEGSRQPLATPDGRFHIVYNGEIYNYRELRAELEAEGVRFRTRGDTEVLLEAYASWGADCVARMNGMFAFAVWDSLERRLFISRDHLGIKPLYYGWWEGLFYAASEAKAIVADPQGAAPDRSRSAGSLLPSRLRALPRGRSGAGCASSRRPTRLELETGPRNWQRHCPTNAALLGPLRWARFVFEEPAGEVAVAAGPWRPTLRCSVERQTVSDVPLGAFLSGGVDSSTRRFLPGRTLRPPGADLLRRLRRAPASTNDPYASDRSHERFGTEHHEILLGAGLHRPARTPLAESYDEPFADPAALPTAAGQFPGPGARDGGALGRRR